MTKHMGRIVLLAIGVLAGVAVMSFAAVGVKEVWVHYYRVKPMTKRFNEDSGTARLVGHEGDISLWYDTPGIDGGKALWSLFWHERPLITMYEGDDGPLAFQVWDGDFNRRIAISYDHRTGTVGQVSYDLYDAKGECIGFQTDMDMDGNVDLIGRTNEGATARLGDEWVPVRKRQDSWWANVRGDWQPIEFKHGKWALKGTPNTGNRQ